MEQVKKQSRIWLWIALALFVFVGFGFILSGDQPQTYKSYLSKSPSPTGVKAFYTYLQKDKGEVERWYGQPRKLRNLSQKQTLMMVEPYFRFSEEDMLSYQNWMEQGNTILLLKNDPVGYFNTKVELAETSSGPLKVENKHGETFKAQLPVNKRLRLKENDVELLSDERGTVALKRFFGKGELIVSLQPEWVTNGNILEKDHTELALYLLNQTEASSILIDEYVHGQENLPTYLTVYPKSLLVFILQLAILTIFILWIKGKRFGPVYLPREAEVRFGDERLRALAAWYMRSDFYNESLSIQEQYVRQSVSDKWGVSIQHSWEDIFETIKPRLTKEQINKWSEWVRELHKVRQTDQWSKKDYVIWSQKLDEIRKEVQEG
ncbi:DUF4350 domain-containing protein [Pontibacillus marinus]|uniref:DUF4350 domain-containing protein n=1 Tax=Pontibacillus marinus BH030004 = DSM 16465 TaxID=1385511 RepID=A0A0A5I4A2_9BACI|nr:DUF4350 domain-containing protein [Pontibacillus marinus]KGX90657.1 hypothetical protein N783_20065 [Pontibacillus marinus BH030004 = DSM 16465]